MTTIKKPLDVESTSSTNIKNMWSSRITCKEGNSSDSDDVGNAAETTSSDDSTLCLL